MKALLLIALLVASPVVASVSERVILVSAGDEPDMTPVTALLAEGWTVKHQSMAGAGDRYNRRVWIVFTLTPPSPEFAAKAAEAKRLEFERRRAEYLAKKNGTAVEGVR